MSKIQKFLSHPGHHELEHLLQVFSFFHYCFKILKQSYNTVHVGCVFIPNIEGQGDLKAGRSLECQAPNCQLTVHLEAYGHLDGQEQQEKEKNHSRCFILGDC